MNAGFVMQDAMRNVCPMSQRYLVHTMVSCWTSDAVRTTTHEEHRDKLEVSLCQRLTDVLLVFAAALL